MAGGVSNLGNFLTQSSRVRSLRESLNLAQEQIATGKKSDVFSGLGIRVQEVQRLRADINISERYMDGIKAASVRADLMDNSIEEMLSIAIDIRDSITLTAAEGSEPDVNYLKNLAQTNLNFLEQLMNLESNGRFLFAGSNISTRPLDNTSALNSNIQSELSDWFDGSQTVTQLLSNVEGFAGTDLGYALSLNSSTGVTARIDAGQDVDYAVLANESGFSDLLRVTAVMANLDFPDESDPLVFATKDDYYDVLQQMGSILDSAIDDMTQSQSRLAIARTNMQSAQTRHEQDIVFFENIVSGIEDVDIAEAVVRLQSIETQLGASYQTISMVNDLSLVNFI